MINTKTFRTGLAAVVGAAVLFAGVVAGASIARADDNGQENTVQEGPLHGVADQLRSRALEMCGRIGDVADQLGMDLEELQQRISDGATLQELADEAGVDLDAMLNAIRDTVTAEIEERIADGSLDDERGRRLRERIESFNFDDLPDLQDFGFHHRDFADFDGMRPFGGRDWLGDLNLDLGELRDKLASGMTLEEALADLGVDLDAAIADARASALEKIDEMVANGTLDEARAAQLKEMIENFNPSGGEFPFGNFGDLGNRGGWGHFPGRGGNGFGHWGDGTADVPNGEGVLLDI